TIHLTITGMIVPVGNAFPLVGNPCKTSPGKNDRFPSMWLLHILFEIRAVLDFTLLRRLIRLYSALVCSSCSSAQKFASGFLQIPPHDGHPCLWLTVPTAKPVADFHRLAVVHAGRTQKRHETTRFVISCLS
ncbi:hypothetical protein SAMN02982927_02826, partial [Sporolactobacillus nakayamae]